MVAMWPFIFPLGLTDLAGPGWLILCAGLAVEGSRWVERARERQSNTPYKDFYSMWAMTAALVFKPSGAAVFVVVLYTWARLRVNTDAPAYRWIFSTATVVLSVAVSSASYGALVGPWAWSGGLLHDPVAPLIGLGAGALSVALNTLLVAGAILFVEPKAGFRRALGVNRHEGGVDTSAICLAVLVACGYEISPWLAVLTLPVILLLERTLLLSQFQTAARIDAKTGLPNAAWWYQIAQAEFGRTHSADDEVSVLIGDLDHFKRVNDTYGHLAGDVVLRHVARVFAGGVRDNDVVGRFGGEEFVVLLPHTNAEQAVRIAERLRRAVAALRVEIGAGAGCASAEVGVTVSIGSATFPEHGEDLADLLRCADAAMYEAKFAGRNQVRCALGTVGRGGAANTAADR